MDFTLSGPCTDRPNHSLVASGKCVLCDKFGAFVIQPWTSIDDLAKANSARGYHFFDRDTLRFFSSRIGQTVYQGTGGIYFVTSEQNKGFGEFKGSPRAYTVRQFIPETCNVKTIGEFNRLSKSAANRLAKALSKGESNGN